MTDIAPPATDEWWDPVSTKAAVLHQLRLREGDVDEDRVEALIPVAGHLINVYLDRPADSSWPVAATLQPALEQVTIELYRRKDAPLSGSNDWASTAGMLPFGQVDPIAQVAAELAGQKRRWGVG